MLTVEQIQQHFLELLNAAIRRPGMFGPGEFGLDHAMTSVAYVTETGDQWVWRKALEARGAWTPVGASGWVRLLMPGTEQVGSASLYADYAHERGWLTLDRALEAGEYAEVCGELGAWCSVDRLRADVVERFGEPSVRIGGSGNQVLGYGRPGEPLVWFHTADDEALLAGRRGGEAFEESLRFTPEGVRRRPVG